MSRSTVILFTVIAAQLVACCCFPAQQQPAPNKNVVVETARPDVRTEPPIAETPKFLTHDQAANLGNIRVQLVSGGMGKLKYVSDRGTSYMSKDDRFWVKLRITNTSETKLDNYHPWSGRDFSLTNDRASIVDEFGNRYFNIHSPSIGTSGVDGQLRRITRLDPGASIDDLIAFDRPIEKSNEFTFDLPGENIGNRGSRIVYKLPRSFFVPAK
jgi:hypothetical protein